MQTMYRILKNGEHRLTAAGRVLADGTIRLADSDLPIVLAAECEARGLDPKKVLKAKAPVECLAKLGLNPGGVEVITGDEYDARQASARRAKIDALEKAVPGVEEMRLLQEQTRAEADRYQRGFARMMADEYNDGVFPPRKENASLGEKLATMRQANPRAALYLRAEKQAQGTTSFSATSGQMKGGQDALAILRTGGSLEDAEKALAFRYATDDWH